MNNQQLVSIGNELITSVKGIFPQNAEFECHYDSTRLAFVCTVYWKLNNDDRRPNKPSRIIVIVVSSESIEDSGYEKRKSIVHERFKTFIQAKYNQFTPNHDEPYGKPPPTEEWLIDNNLLNH